MKNPALWYKDAVLYEVRVRAFYDSDDDGIGDFRGLTRKLDYLQDLGVDTLWVLPFYPSPLKDDGYDISDYTAVHPDCGTLQDFKQFVRAAHRRNLRVVTELVLNHTSDQHAWFQRARQAKPGSKWRDFYVWSNDPDRYKDARIIFKDFEASNWTWDGVARAYFWHRFYSSQPDLNFDHPPVRRTVLQAMDFWFAMGVDGMRLDAVPYLFERDGTNCENLPETHAFLKSLRRHVDQKFRHRMLLAEANQWPEDAAAYFGDADECHMAFHFPIMPRLFMALHMEDRYPVVEILEQTPVIADTAQWALFLRNHDELTLEMVTDEERDYMYRVYAHDPQARINLGIRRRLAPLLGNDRRRIELMNGLLFSLPGTPVLYYGDEIGMGDNFYLGDRNGVRTPMQWSGDRNAGFSRANPQRLYLPVVIDPEYHYETVNVEAQQQNPHSMLWWMKRLIALRKRYKAFGRGSLEFLHPSNRKVLAFLRRYGDERILVVANLSRFVQYVELDLAKYRDMLAVELFGGTDFPTIGELPYLLTLSPHAFYWFALVPARREEIQISATPDELPVIEATGSWEGVLVRENGAALEEVLPGFLRHQRWFGGKARRIKEVELRDAIPIRSDEAIPAVLVLAAVEYTEGSPERYAIPVAFATGDGARWLENHALGAVIARLQLTKNGKTTEGVIYDAVGDPELGEAFLAAIERRRQFKGREGTVTTRRTRALRALAESDTPLAPSLAPWEQSNSSILFGDRLVLKLFRHLSDGVNPDLEVGRFLTEKTSFANIPPVAGQLEYRIGRGEPTTLAILQGFVLNEGDAWKFTLDEVERYFERVLIHRQREGGIPDLHGTALDHTTERPPEVVTELVSGYLEMARLLGRRTAELHRALASSSQDPAFAPEPFTRLYQRALFQSMRNLCTRVFQQLADTLPTLPKHVTAEAEQVLALKSRAMRAFRGVADARIKAQRIRCHGDYHLGQVLWTGKDFVVIDFEGEPARAVTERRIKRSPLRDVAGMLRSFHYAAATVFATRVVGQLATAEEAAAIETWERFWRDWVASAFLRAYLHEMAESGLLPANEEELRLLLNTYLLDKAVYELGYELNNRPDWVWIPLKGILQLFETP
jgi:maltose alpha-D-glucosyltransferase/alpha-amylase